MIHLKKSIILFAAGTLMLLNSCSKDEQVVSPTIDNEALTTVELQLTNLADANDQPRAQWEQLLDNNGNPESIDVSQANLTLKANATYNAKLILLDKTQNPVFVVSDEIQERANYHLFFYQPLPTNKPSVIPHNASDPNDVYPEPIPNPVPDGNPLALTVALTDHDTNPQQYPVGLESTFTTGAASAGWLRVVLRHQPNSKNGTYAPGSTDLDVGFVVTIQ
jgi:hypothetical protein